MKRKSKLTSSTRRPFHQEYSLPLSILSFFIGVMAMFAFTHVFAQNFDTNQIYACVNDTNGSVRIVTSSDTCKQHEKSLKWSIQGPPGPPGPAGQTGGLNQYFGLPFICNACSLSGLADHFAGKDFSYAMITSSDFGGADLTAVEFGHAFLSNDVFLNANLTNADLSNIRELPGNQIPQNNNFTGANLTNANLSNSLQHETLFKNANLQGANFSNGTLRRAKFNGAKNMSTANFSGATFESVTCPDGTNSDNNGSSCAGHY